MDNRTVEQRGTLLELDAREARLNEITRLGCIKFTFMDHSGESGPNIMTLSVSISHKDQARELKTRGALPPASQPTNPTCR